MDKRTILFVLLTLLIWMGYIFYVAPYFNPPPKEQPKLPITQADNKPAVTPTPATTVNAQPVSNTLTAYKHPDVPLTNKIIGNDYIQASFTNKGAALESVTLSKYCKSKSKDALKLVCPIEVINQNNFILSLTGYEAEMRNANWVIAEETPGQSVTFRYTADNGVIILKQFSVQGNYSLDYKISLENTSDKPITPTLTIGGINGIIAEQKDQIDLFGVRAYNDKIKNKWYVKDEVTPTSLIKDKDNNDRKTKVGLLITDLERARKAGREQADKVEWAGLVNKYFASILIPANPADIAEYSFSLMDNNKISFALTAKEFTLNPAGKQSYDFTFYSGPKLASELAAMSKSGLDNLLNYGMFGFISKIILFLLASIYGLFKNYGVAIIILTIIIKVALFPLTKKSQVSMYNLQKLTPRIKALQEQFKNDKQRLASEQMKLWKEYGVNPLSGCLPMFFQIPVFIGLWQALSLSIELRQSTFMLWISDLSQPDVLFNLPFTMPLVGWTELHLLPLLMTASWLIQSLTQPKSPDPQTRQQQKMMMFMPLIFMFMFYNFPSGLTLYWFTSTLLGIVEQLLIKKFYLR
ncbi:MAG: membrane protein insertase YidC [Candidatus Brocadiia bacterium]